MFVFVDSYSLNYKGYMYNCVVRNWFSNEGGGGVDGPGHWPSGGSGGYGLALDGIPGDPSLDTN